MSFITDKYGKRPIVVAASGNQHKIKELQELFGDIFNVISMHDAGFDMDIVEDADTFAGNAIIKAEAVTAFTNMISLADDSGLTVDALGGEPGVYSARYSGVHGNDLANNELLLSKMKDISNRNAQFRCAVALKIPEKKPVVAEGICEGIILDKYQGKGGFGYDPLFYYPPLGKTYAEMNDQEKNSCSHRARASAEMLRIVKELISDAGIDNI